VAAPRDELKSCEFWSAYRCHWWFADISWVWEPGFSYERWTLKLLILFQDLYLIQLLLENTISSPIRHLWVWEEL
jgi:hypothetical protein